MDVCDDNHDGFDNGVAVPGHHADMADRMPVRGDIQRLQKEVVTVSDLIRREDAIQGIREMASCADVAHDSEAYVYMIRHLPSADSGRYIDRAELFNRLAYIKAPPEANEYKAEVYMLIQSM